MPESETFSRLLEQETQKWIDEEISKGNDAWNARRSFDGLSNIHWDMVAQSAAQIQEHLAGSGQNMTQGIFLCRCIQKHRPELLQKAMAPQHRPPTLSIASRRSCSLGQAPPSRSSPRT